MFNRLEDKTRYNRWIFLKKEKRDREGTGYRTPERPCRTVSNGVYNFNPPNWRSLRETVEEMGLEDQLVTLADMETEAILSETLNSQSTRYGENGATDEVTENEVSGNKENLVILEDYIKKRKKEIEAIRAEIKAKEEELRNLK